MSWKVDEGDVQMLRLMGISQTSRNKMEESIEESRREEILRAIKAKPSIEMVIFLWFV